MSGIVGIVNTDGAPVPRDLLARMAEFLRFRGPDARNLWCDFEVGFAHALLDTSGVGAKDEQPCSIDGRVWIVADARVDARTELSGELRSSGITVPPGASDAELILLAYQLWGQDCLYHLLGDFAFAIWDGPCKQLFCARDQFGVKPFYYANLADCFVFSNTLNCLRLHPNVSSRLNDLAISDYLLFGSNQDPCTTSFEQIQRLAPGHFLLCSEGKFRISKYWTLQQTSEARYKERQDYVEHFRALLRTAVQDRLRSDRVAVFMSGGLDSSTVAAVAHRVLGDDDQSRLQAYSVVYDKLIPDQERRFAGIVSDFCGVPLHYLVADDYQLFEGSRDQDPCQAEPRDQPLLAMNHDLYTQVAVQSRVVLTGEGGDPCLLPSPGAILKLLRTGKGWGVASGYVRCALWQRSLPRAGLRSLIRARTDAAEESFIPEWINPELALKLDLSQRWKDLQREPIPIDSHRPEAYRNLCHCGWANSFEVLDPGNSPLPVEARHPFFDLRLVDFLLSLPTLPWCIGKQIIREAMMGFLPLQVLRRRKAALAGDPVVELLKQPQSSWIDSFQPTPELLHYVRPSRIPPIAGKPNSSADAWRHLRPLSLDHWLRRQATVESKKEGKVFPWISQPK
jgi:asparagine synthase (glutamine-hydrolysing)